MNKLFGVLVPLLLISTAYAERRAEPTLDKIIQQFGGSLQFQTSDGDWEVLENSTEEGYAAGRGVTKTETTTVTC